MTGWFDIAYSFLIGEDGRVYEGRGWDREGGHTRGFNAVSLASSMMGNFMLRPPEAPAITALKNLLACGVENGKLASNYKMYGHRDAEPSTLCPGDYLYKDIQTWPHYDFNKPQHP